MLPASPTAQPWVASGKATPQSVTVIGELCLLQVAPPSVVARIVAPSPTAQPWVASLKATPMSGATLPE